MGEITVILVLALIFIGPKKLPELASGLGRLIREIRKTTNDVKNEIQLDDAIRKPFEELRDAVTLPPEELKRRDRIKRELRELEKQAAEQAARQAAGLEAGELPPALAEDGTSEPPPEAPMHGFESNVILPEVMGSGGPASEGDGAFGDGHHDHLAGAGGLVDNSAAAIALAAVPTEASLPNLTGAAPAGTVARGSLGASVAVPPLPPSIPHVAPPPSTASSSRRGPPLPVPSLSLPSPSSSPSSSTEQASHSSSDTVPAGSGVSSELLRALRPDARKTPVAPQNAFAPGVVGGGIPMGLGSADRSNTTQVLSEADLATLASTPTPPPPPPASVRPTGKGLAAVTTASNGPPLPGSTPPKPPTSSST